MTPAPWLTELPLLLALLVPLVLMAAFIRSRGHGPRRWLPLASLPALALALWPGSGLHLPGVLLGTQLGTTLGSDGLARALLLLMGLAWSAAAWFAADRMQGPHFRSFAVAWLAGLSGMVLAAAAADIATFYTGYVAMTLAGYGLVMHDRDAPARRAARIYIVLAMVGEALILSGLLLLAARIGNADLATLPSAVQGFDARLAGALLLGGFSVKIGIVPLHVWLPLAHPVAPVPASAILSGVLVKAGLLGAVRLVPAEAFDAFATAGLLALGLITTFYGAAMGLAQQRLKTVLAYSTISQMGLLFVVLVLVLAPGERRDGPLMAVLALWLLHHGLNKAALFLAAGSAPGVSRWRMALVALPALSLAGLPPASGALAKAVLKESLYGTTFAGWVVPWLAASSLATSLLMLHVFSLARGSRAAPHASGPPPPVHPAWALLVLAALVVPWLHAGVSGLARWPGMKDILDATWPLLAAGVLWLLRGRLVRALRWARRIPEGDLVVVAERAAAILAGAAGRLAEAADARRQRLAASIAHASALGEALARRMQKTESTLVALPVVGLLLLGLAGLVWWSLAA